LFTGSASHDAQTDKVAIAGTTEGAVYAFDEFKNFAGLSGAAADAEWTAIVDCTRKIYSYYDTVVTDVKPASGTYHRAVLSGVGSQLIQGADSTLLGISDVECTGPIHNMTAFTFADAHRAFANNAARYVKDLCVTVTHEAGHSFGLEHQFEFLDGTSACSDPMSYDTGECDPPFRFFRNKPAKCGGFELTPCFCSAAANSHVKLTGVFGAATIPPTIAPPIAEVTTPVPDAQLGANIIVSAGHDRGVERVALFINGHEWTQQPGLEFVRGGGQPNPGFHTFPIPARLPDSIVDIQVRVYDDLGNATDSPVVTAIKGAACADASTCATGQQCEAGRCFWDQPAGVVGDDCTYPEFCLSGQCSNTTFAGDTAVCTQACIVGSPDACPDGLECTAAGNGAICFVATDGGGCCSASSTTPWGPLVIGLCLVGYLARRRRVTP